MQLARTSLPARRAFFSTNGSGLLMRPLAPQRIVKGRVAADGQDASVQVATSIPETTANSSSEVTTLAQRVKERAASRRREQMTYQVTAIIASLGVGSLGVGATWYRFFYHLQDGSPFPWLDMGCTLALVVGGVFGMEMWARYAHKALWHDYEPGWSLHKSHHEPRTGPFEANDIYALVNAIPAMSLCMYGFVTPTLAGSLCFGAGLGITLFGIMYMFIHDGLVHRRFPVGPIAEVPAMKRIIMAHRLHHTEKYGGVPYGMFFGPQELEEIGAGPELDRLVAEMESGKPTVNA